MAACGATAQHAAGITDSPRLLREVIRHLDTAYRLAAEGKWQMAIAHTQLVAPVGRIAYRVEVDGPLRPEYRRALTDAEHLWEAALDYQVDFIEDEKMANVAVRFQPSVANQGREVGGHAKWVRSVRGFSESDVIGELRASVWIRTEQPTGGSMTHAQLRHVIAHEFGHLLGMNDSPRIGDIMGPIDLSNPANKLTFEEASALISLRERALDVRRTSLRSVLQSIGR